MRTSPPLARSVAVIAAAALAGAAAFAADSQSFAELKARYDKAAKNHDDSGIRERRKLLLACFDYLEQKPCRKLLREAFDADDATDTRVAAVQVLAASGDPKDLDAIVKGVAKDRLRGPTIAIGEGISYTSKEASAAASIHALELAVKAKGDLRIALLEGVGELGDPAAYDALVALGDKLLPEEHFVRYAALGACGREKAVPALVPGSKTGSAIVRRGAVTGLARSGAKESLAPLVEALHDVDSRVVEIAAEALGAAKHQPAAAALADALAIAPLRTRFAARAALAAIYGKDHGLEAAPWRGLIEGKKPEPPVVPPEEPKLPQFFGIPVASDRVVALLDISHSMAWNGRLLRAQDGVTQFLDALADSAAFNVYTVAKVTDRFAKGMTAGAAARGQAAAWVRKQLNASSFDLQGALLQVLEDEPDADTILVATDSLPWGEGSAQTSLEVLEVFRRANLTRRVRVHIAFVVPGGRFVTSEAQPDEFEDRATLLQRFLAETSGGKFVRIDQ